MSFHSLAAQLAKAFQAPIPIQFSKKHPSIIFKFHIYILPVAEVSAINYSTPLVLIFAVLQHFFLIWFQLTLVCTEESCPALQQRKNRRLSCEHRINDLYACYNSCSCCLIFMDAVGAAYFSLDAAGVTHFVDAREYCMRWPNSRHARLLRYSQINKNSAWDWPWHSFVIL